MINKAGSECRVWPKRPRPDGPRDVNQGGSEADNQEVNTHPAGWDFPNRVTNSGSILQSHHSNEGTPKHTHTHTHTEFLHGLQASACLGLSELADLSGALVFNI